MVSLFNITLVAAIDFAREHEAVRAIKLKGFFVELHECMLSPF